MRRHGCRRGEVFEGCETPARGIAAEARREKARTAISATWRQGAAGHGASEQRREPRIRDRAERRPGAQEGASRRRGEEPQGRSRRWAGMLHRTKHGSGDRHVRGNGRHLREFGREAAHSERIPRQACHVTERGDPRRARQVVTEALRRRRYGNRGSAHTGSFEGEVSRRCAGSRRPAREREGHGGQG